MRLRESRRLLSAAYLLGAGSVSNLQQKRNYEKEKANILL